MKAPHLEAVAAETARTRYVVFCPLSWCRASFSSTVRAEAIEAEREHWRKEHAA